MTLILLILAGILLGYLIPVLASLFFTLSVGRVAPRMLSAGGRIKPGFVVMHGILWAVAAAGAGYVIGMIVPTYGWLACGVAGLLLIGALVSNVGEMKKQQSPVQIGGMVLATAAGLACGLAIYLKTAVPVVGV